MEGRIWLNSWYWLSRLAPAFIVGVARLARAMRYGFAIREAISIAVILAAMCACTSVGSATNGVTVDDLVGRTVISSWSVSPDGSYVAFLTAKALPRLNIYEITLRIRPTTDSAQSRILAQYSLKPQEVYEADSHRRRKTVSQYLWSSDSRWLLYTVHSKTGMELRAKDVPGGKEMTVLSAPEYVEIEEAKADQRGWRIKTFVHEDGANERRDVPKDMALLVKDSYRFYAPLPNPKRGLPIVSESWEYDLEAVHATKIANTRASEYWGYPDEYSWDGRTLETHLTGPLPEERHNPMSSDGSGTAESDPVELNLDWQPDRTIVLVREKGAVRKIHEENVLLIEHYSEAALDNRRKTYLSQDGRLAVMLRSTNLVPDELVKLDLKTGKMVSLFSPNEIFREKTQGIIVRFMPIDVADGKLHGRLFLPADYDKSERYPLVFAPYLSTAGFNLGSGELPILPLVAHGIAVFALDARNATNGVGQGNNFASELLRVERPLEAMGWVVEKLAREGIIDPKRVGLNGLSYGAEISMYAYWKSDMFRTVSATDGTWEPMLYTMGGVGSAEYYSNRGFPEPRDGAYAEWKKLSAGLNARPTLPPLLWQSPDQEESNCIETWVRLRRAGAQVEWVDYPDEGHVKRAPANIWWVHERNLDWFRFWLKDQEDADPAKAEQYTRWREMRKNWEAAKAAAKAA